MPKIKSLQTSETAGLTRIKIALKRALKQKGYTYRDIAKLWQCSEPTVKRLLGSEELPASRLLSLLEFLELNLKELHALIEREDLDNPRWTARQNDFLSTHPKHFAFLMKLYEGGATPQSIARKHKIAAAEVERILLQLEKYDLIRIGAKGDVKPWYSRMPILEGKLGAAHTTRILDRMNAYLKGHVHEELGRQLRGLEKQNRGQISCQISLLSEKSYSEFVDKMERLSREVESIAKIEENSLGKSELKPVVSITGLIFNKSRSQGLDQLEDIFSEDLRPAKDELNIPRGL